MRYLILTVLVLLTSCASFSGEWGEWKISDTTKQDQDWKFCDGDLHGPEYHRKGMCYWQDKCRVWITMFGNENEDKKQCVINKLFCKWGDLACMDSNDLFGKIIVNREKLR